MDCFYTKSKTMSSTDSNGTPADRLAALFHRRWAVPVLAELAAGPGAKFVTLVRRLGVSRETLRATLDELILAGWVMRNPGTGHPMRPEYLLTARGRRLAPPSSRLVDEVRRLDIEPLAFRKWTMPVAYVLGGSPHRFSELRSELAGVSPRALTLSLKDMCDADLVGREVIDDYPPVTSYRLETRARTLVRALRPLARAV